MTHATFDRFDRRNDPDLQDERRCRHRVGDPDCMCHDAEDEARNALDIANAKAHIAELRTIIDEALAPPTDRLIESDELRAKLDIRARVQSIVDAIWDDL